MKTILKIFAVPILAVVALVASCCWYQARYDSWVDAMTERCWAEKGHPSMAGGTFHCNFAPSQTTERLRYYGGGS